MWLDMWRENQSVHKKINTANGTQGNLLRLCNYMKTFSLNFFTKESITTDVFSVLVMTTDTHHKMQTTGIYPRCALSDRLHRSAWETWIRITQLF